MPATITRENGIVLIVSLFVGFLFAVALAAGLSANFVTLGSILVGIVFLLRVVPRADAFFGILGAVIGIILALFVPQMGIGTDGGAVLVFFNLLIALHA